MYFSSIIWEYFCLITACSFNASVEVINDKLSAYQIEFWASELLSEIW